MTLKTYDTFGEKDHNRNNLENDCSIGRKAIFAILICAIIALGFTLVEYYKDTAISSDNSWDYLLFTQQWPISFCTSYTEEKEEPVDECSFAHNKYDWTIHGLWPSRSNSTAYPEFCTRTRFNATTLEPIKDQLLEHWSTIQKDSPQTYLWKHEWSKHGTCATQIESLNTEFKYFSQGLAWNNQYNITKALINCSIYPSDEKLYTNDEVINCIKQQFNVEPQIFCTIDDVRNELMLTEVRLCFDKKLELVGCDTLGAELRCKDDFVYPANVMNS